MRAFVALILCLQAALVLSDSSPNPCPTSQTCCESHYPGVVGYCPSPNAVCCLDKLHCCPQNTVCNLSQGTCDRQDQLIPFSFRKRKDIPGSKLQAVENKEAHEVNVVYCRDGRHYCNDGNTCCITPAGQYTCCPYPLASCCHDGLHCCPHGSRCDSTSRYCLQADSLWAVAFALKKTPALTLPVQ